MGNNSNNVSRIGFTAIEMMVVVSIVIVLVAMVVPTIGPAMKRGSVQDSANAIQRACSMARQLARSNSEPSVDLKWYGVSVVVPSDNTAAYAVVIYGSEDPASSVFSNSDHQYPNGTPLLDGSTNTSYNGYKPAGKFPLNSSVMPFKDSKSSTPLACTFLGKGTAVGWYYQYRTGFVFTDPSRPGVGVDFGVPVPVGGTVPSPAPIESFGVSSLDKKYKIAIAVYKIGLLNAQDVN